MESLGQKIFISFGAVNYKSDMYLELLRATGERAWDASKSTQRNYESGDGKRLIWWCYLSPALTQMKMPNQTWKVKLSKADILLLIKPVWVDFPS